MDSNLVVQVIQMKEPTTCHLLASMINECKQMMDQIGQCKFRHVYCEKNSAADCLANASFNGDMGLCLLDTALVWDILKGKTIGCGTRWGTLDYLDWVLDSETKPSNLSRQRLPPLVFHFFEITACIVCSSQLLLVFPSSSSPLRPLSISFSSSNLLHRPNPGVGGCQ
ncbi:hypothetical protein L3X38_026405 [Prunus dulcis]|uniref:RNase H type-1 domain-containing protein n=1 Tax=Prunus dulcis TaxID=3755 RepID=A0AAD4YZF4_PRUDU|nr:hypothetical protein L3X38_026405 [Prunus dulcis]